MKRRESATYRETPVPVISRTTKPHGFLADERHNLTRGDFASISQSADSGGCPAAGSGHRGRGREATDSHLGPGADPDVPKFASSDSASRAGWVSRQIVNHLRKRRILKEEDRGAEGFTIVLPAFFSAPPIAFQKSRGRSVSDRSADYHHDKRFCSY